jgi:2-amino-1-hydroxyethylphosphonate dioxygenase (glycine-forming)
MGEIEEVFAVMEAHGSDDYIGESVTQLEHMLQAAYLAQKSGADEELVLGSFFHDIGHLCAPPEAPRMDHLGVADHEHLGADFLSSKGFSPRVTELVRLHVQAKRYFCLRRSGYLANLSEASRGTLNFQGGAMNEKQGLAFEAHPLFKDILRLRTWDEAAKVVNGSALSMEQVKQIATRHLENRTTATQRGAS